MPNETLAKRYAQAIFSLAQDQKQIDAAGKELRVLSDAIEENPATKEFFISPVVERSEKEKILGAAFSGKTLDIVFHTLLLLVRKHRERLLPEIVRQYEALQMQQRGVEAVTITSARKLSDGEIREIVARLEKTYGKSFEPRTRIEPGLIGGVRVLIGDRRFDGTVEGRLQELSHRLYAEN